MNNKTLIIFIVIIAAATIIIVSWRTPSNNNDALTPTPTVTATGTATPTVTATGTPTTSGTATPTVTVSATPTATATATPTPTPTISGSFNEIVNPNWIYSVKEQTVSGYVYFIDSTNPKVVKKGTSKTDASAKVVFTSETNGEIGSLLVNGSYLYVVTKRDSTTSYSKIQRVTLSSGTKAKIYDFYSAKYDAVLLAINKNNDTKAGFYVGLQGVANKYEPAAMYIKSYSQQWIRPFAGVDKLASVTAMAPLTDGTKLAGLFMKETVQSQAFVDLN